MPKTKHRLRWKPENVAKILTDNGIQDRNHLSKTIHVGRTTVYSAFGPDWSGDATAGVLAAVARTFDAKLDDLAEAAA
ncbi:transcriptional repressor [Mycobacterium phage Yuna]|uniref:Cro protein n=1 Tax=Mycobacterium phage Yuna TaxID=2599885 RepID=A0A5J6TL23_9CAUD|nr:transcriptional repressor [Mycobacterium phage Yuna]QFG09432.1 Cro protein [Mycobacterium phage Yuna]